jgi:hypothetical protein
MESELEIRDRIARYDAEGTNLKELKYAGNLSELGQKRLETLEDFSFICRCILAESDEDKQKKRNSKIEKLAAIDHDQWVYWSSGVAPMIKDLLKLIWAYQDCIYSTVPSKENKELVYGGGGGDLLKVKTAAHERMKRWELLQKTPYAELPEEYKDDDRKWAKKELEVAEM